MTVLIKNDRAVNYIGLSSDGLPINVIEGSTLHKIDTGEQLVSHDGIWEQDLRLIFAIQAATG